MVQVLGYLQQLVVIYGDTWVLFQKSEYYLAYLQCAIQDLSESVIVLYLYVVSIDYFPANIQSIGQQLPQSGTPTDTPHKLGGHPKPQPLQQHLQSHNIQPNIPMLTTLILILMHMHMHMENSLSESIDEKEDDLLEQLLVFEFFYGIPGMGQLAHSGVVQQGLDHVEGQDWPFFHHVVLYCLYHLMDLFETILVDFQNGPGVYFHYFTLVWLIIPLVIIDDPLEQPTPTINPDLDAPSPPIVAHRQSHAQHEPILDKKAQIRCYNRLQIAIIKLMGVQEYVLDVGTGLYWI